MIKIISFCALSILNFNLMACDTQQAPLDKIIFQVSAKQWINTQSALLHVNVNATLNNAGVVKTRTEIMDNLNKIAQGEWHITQFDRSQDSSGLEKLYVAAQARIPQTSLTDIYQHAKSVSKPGATYSINNVDFTPSLDEVQKGKAQLREQLYRLVNEEMTRINKVYADQHFALNNLYLVDGDSLPAMQPKNYQAKEMNTMVMAAASQAPVSVSNELVMTALVEAASARVPSTTVSNNASAHH